MKQILVSLSTLTGSFAGAFLVMAAAEYKMPETFIVGAKMLALLGISFLFTSVLCMRKAFKRL